MNIFKGKNVINTISFENNLRALNVEVQDGEVVIKTPNYLTKEDLKKIIDDIKMAVEKRQERHIQNEVVKIFGEDCKVKINYKNLKKPQLIVEEKNIKICLPNKYKKLNKDEIVEKLIEKLYMYIAEGEIESVMEKYRNLLGFAPEDYQLKFINKIAKCSKENVITINPEIVAYSKNTIEYIVLHQFCHIKYKSHSAKFYEMLGKYMPNYAIYEREIQESMVM